MSKLIIFEVSSSFGFFRKGFTSTNALTHAMIPRSSVEGLVSAIIGLPRKDYPDELQFSEIAIEILSPVRKLAMKYMHTNPKWWTTVVSYYIHRTDKALLSTEQFAIPASAEFLVNPSYRIYIDASKDINNQLLINLKNKQTNYTPYLGTSSMICSLRNVNESEYKNIPPPTKYIQLSSILHFSNTLPRIELKKDSRFAIEEDLTMHIDNKRRPCGTYSVVYNPETGPINITNEENLVEVKIEDNNHKYVKFLPTKVTS
jgi:CRISPR-associated protein Cas5h